MTSPSEYTAGALAAAIHRAMCYRGASTPVCVSDHGDGLLVAADLADHGWRLTRIAVEKED